jgi:iron complex outermembrane receptor protein
LSYICNNIANIEIMKHFTLQLIFILTGSLQMIAQKQENSLAGKVTDKATKEAIAYAIVSLPDLHISLQADTNGNFKFTKIPAASYEMLISGVGYSANSVYITVKGETFFSVELDNSKAELSEVVVTGMSKATEIKKSPLAIVTVNKEYLATNISTNIIDAIAKIPGVNAVTTGPNVSKPYIRGLGYNRILTLFDGVRQEGQQWGDEHGIEIDKYLIEKVEIIKGPASLMYGSDALGGVINLIPGQGGLNDRINGNFTSEYQSNNGMFGESLFLTGNKKGIEWGGRISKRNAADFQNKIDGRVYNTGFDETAANLFAGIHKKWGFSDLNLSLYDNLQEIPDGSRDSLTRKFTKQITEDDTFRPIVSDKDLRSYGISAVHQRVQHYRAFLKNMFFFENSQLSVNVGFQRSVRREYSHPEAPYQLTPGLYLQLNTLNYDIKYFLPEFKQWAVVVGLNGMYQTNDASAGTKFVIPSFHQFDLGGFATAKRDFGRLHVSGGLRYDVRRFTNNALYIKPNLESGFDQPVTGVDTSGANKSFAAYETQFGGFSASMGTAYLLNTSWTLKANLSRGYRAPNISEISANGVHPGTGYFQIGNAAFKPELSLQGDIGLAYVSKSINAGASFFINQVEQYIFNSRLLKANGSDSLSVSGSHQYPTYKFLQGSVLLYGMEANVDFHIIQPLHFENTFSVTYGDNYSFSGNQRNSTNRYVPFMPPLRYTSELRYDISLAGKTFSDSFIKLQLNYTDTQNRVYTSENTETVTDGYTLINTGIGTGIKNKKGNTWANFYVLINNIFDIAYQDHLSRLKYFEQFQASPNGKLGIYNMGRNVSLKVIFQI